MADAEPAYEDVVARIDRTLGQLQRALVEGEDGETASDPRAGGSSSARAQRVSSPRRRRQQQQQQQPQPRKGGASTLDASAYTAAHGVRGGQSARSSLGSPRRQVRSPRRRLTSPTKAAAGDAGEDGDDDDDDLLDDERPSSSFGTSGRFQGAHTSTHFMEHSVHTPGPAAYGASSCDAAAAQRTFGTIALASPERRGRGLGSPDRAARVRSPTARRGRAGSGKLGSPRRQRADVGSPRVGGGSGSGDVDMIASWWDAHHSLTDELWGPGADSQRGRGGGGGGVSPSDQALGAAYLGLYGVLRRTAVRAHIKLSSAVVGSLNPGATVEVLEARVLMPPVAAGRSGRGAKRAGGAQQQRNSSGPRVHVRLRSRYGKSSMAICGWACLVTADGHTLLQKLAEDLGQGAEAAAVTVKKKKKQKKKKKKKSSLASAGAEAAVAAIAAEQRPTLGDRDEHLRLGSPSRAARRERALITAAAASSAGL